MTEHSCGSVHRQPVPAIADRAARHVLAYASPRAVTITPEGGVFVEPPASAAESDLVGVYTAGDGLLALSRQLIEDLRYEVQTRSLRPARTRHLGAGARRARGIA